MNETEKSKNSKKNAGYIPINKELNANIKSIKNSDLFKSTNIKFTFFNGL